METPARPPAFASERGNYYGLNCSLGGTQPTASSQLQPSDWQHSPLFAYAGVGPAGRTDPNLLVQRRAEGRLNHPSDRPQRQPTRWVLLHPSVKPSPVVFQQDLETPAALPSRNIVGNDWPLRWRRQQQQVCR